MEKTCTKCKQVKPLTGFHRRKAMSDGYRSQCKSCSKKDYKAYYDQNSDQIKTSVKEWISRNRERYLETWENLSKGNKLKEIQF